MRLMTRASMGRWLAGCVVSTVAATGLLLAGCGGVNTHNGATSGYAGSYAPGQWSTEGASETYSGVFSMSVDTYGHITGSLRGGNGVISTLDGTVDAQGNVSGELKPSGTSKAYPFTGRAGQQSLDFDALDAFAAGDTSFTPKSTDKFTPGAAGDFRINIDGVTYPGFFQAIGGPSTIGG